MATLGGTIATSGDVQREQAEARVVERRRRLEDERKQRIFNAKQRTIGIDKQALERQQLEKDAATDMEARRDQAFADRLLVTEQRVQLMERDVQRARKEATISVQAYREQMQQRHMRKEWDLNDPHALRKEQPARVGDQDPLIGPSSLQKFSGEDLDYGNRVRKQQQQQATWVVDQMMERQSQIDNEREMERLAAERQAEVDERRGQMEEEEMRARENMNVAVRDYNRALSDVKRDREASRRMQDMEDAQEEIRNQLNSDLLTENPNATVSSSNPNRFLKYNYKGMSPEQQAAVRNEQARQAAEQEERRLREKEEEQNWDLVQEAVRRNLIAGEREVFRRKQELAKQTAEEQRRQAEEARMRKEVLYKQVYAGAIDDTFFMQFGTSSR
mmetsp:Transcript_44139/g.88527  ORF Transcript_44139/g.88527 Transcript_44139/m.88527 type:complete len:388 (-) Transcript_44139:76-1239(-)